ncbi:hypothetical protein F3Y22_tig00113002pilonHSYRG00010 [Hibiscus syriacus]|uniref:Agglutinin domain-containing protein n=1 Tax=Hibiscus syriacus TaxID=106335 RepID=A0A6A2XXG3_HIBSY|nr:hypothetical protein F3Y22_tig00113002pilonHSYRG00010 [Hibiscus syriacus]
MAFTWPKFIVLKSERTNRYLSSGLNAQVVGLETLALRTPCTKFEVQRANSSGEDGLVHIKNCYINKYCERLFDFNPWSGYFYYYAATADKPEEDRSKTACTLFKFISVDTATNKFRFQHVQSQEYLDDFGSSRTTADAYSVFTVFDWELLANWSFLSPSFIVLKYDVKNEYLGFIREKGESYGCLNCSETQILSPNAKFEVEMATSPGTDGLVHIRSCQTNKYWVAGTNSGITVTAKKLEEDRSNELCTLFKIVSVDDAASEVRIRHVQSKRYLRILDGTWRASADSEGFDYLHHDLFMVIDWETSVILPKYVAFKGTDGQYLCLRDVNGQPSLQFASKDIGESDVAMEIFVTNDGNIRIKPNSSTKFWRHNADSIVVDSDYTSSINNMDTVFRPVKVNDDSIALLNLGNNKFCIRDANTSCLAAQVSSITKDVQLKVEEPVLGRKIFGVKYDLDNARVYDETVLVVARNSASNYTDQADTLNVKLSYTDTWSGYWKWMASLKVAAKTTLQFNIPIILDGKIELSGEVQTGSDWGQTTTTSKVVEVVHQVKVPPMTKVTVDLVAKRGKCDVPFTFLQKDSLYNGSGIVYEVQGNSYTGSNYYSTDSQTKQESLSPSI